MRNFEISFTFSTTVKVRAKAMTSESARKKAKKLAKACLFARGATRFSKGEIVVAARRVGRKDIVTEYSCKEAQ